jgi:hypothetical protein
MSDSFISNNYLNIFFCVVFTFLFLSISQLKWNFNPTLPPPKLIQQVTIETMENMDLNINPIDGFCNSFLGDASNLDIACNRLTEDSCSKTSCCVYTDLQKCVAGSVDGPTFKTDKNGNAINNSFFYHLGKKISK